MRYLRLRATDNQLFISYHNLNTSTALAKNVGDMKTSTFLFFALFLLSLSTFGAETLPINLNLQPTIFTDKLTQRSVRQSFQDSRGVMWFITQEGLSRYNGHELENYRHISEEPSSLPTNTVTRIVEDAEGTLWMSSFGGGLISFDSRSNSFEAIFADPNDNQTPYSNDIFTAFADSSGYIWLGYASGFSKFNTSTRTFHHFIPGNGDLSPTGEVQGFTETSDGAVWVATQLQGLLRVDRATDRIRSFSNKLGSTQSIPPGQIFRVVSDQNDKIWIAYTNSGIGLFDPKTETARLFSHSSTDPYSLSSNQTSDIYIDNAGNVWIATLEGLNLYLDEKQSFQRYTRANINIPENLVISVYQSWEGKYWIGTKAGLASGMKTDFQKYDRLYGNLSNESVNAITETEDGTIWVGTDDGLNKMPSNQAEFSWINEATIPAVSDPRVMSLFAENDTLWIGTYSGGLNRLNLKNESVQVFRHSNLDPSSIGANGITSILRTTSGQLLIGTYGGGLSIYHENKDSFTNLTHDPLDESSLSNNQVLAVFEDSLGFIWIGTENGLNLFDIESLTFRPFYADRDGASGLLSRVPWCFWEDKKGTLWIGTSGGGINLWSREKRRQLEASFQHISEELLVPSANIYGIEGDDDGWVWVSHNKGLTRLNPNLLEAHQYSERDGLQDSEFTLGASYKSDTGALYFGGLRGLNAIHPEDIGTERVPPSIGISKIKVMNQIRRFDKPYHKLDQITLSYTDTVFSVEFFAADYSSPSLLNYAYKLDGVNPDWVVSPDSRVASFTTLPAGDYTLNLAAASPDGTWNWDGLSLPIIVEPPPWRSPAAYFAYMLLAAGLIAYYFHYQRQQANQAQKIQKELELRVEERTRDLVAARKEAEEATKAKSDFLATMSHEIRTPMHGIIGMTELLLHTSLSSQQQQFAKAAHRSGESLLGLINEILDFSKVEASKVELESIEFDLIDLIEDICYLQGEPASRKGLNLNHIFGKGIPPKVIGDPTKLRQVVMNLVSNAIKFTHNGNVNVRVSAEDTNSETGVAIIRICVEDDGIGMDQETQTRVFEPFTQADTSTTRQYGGTGLGLSISRHYIDLMGGDIEVVSSIDEGTSITVSTPMEIGALSDPAVPYFNNANAAILADNDAAFEMLASILLRAGVNAEKLDYKSLTEFADESCDVLLVDFDPEKIHGELVSKVENLEARVKILLTPMSGDAPLNAFNQWSHLKKPVMSPHVFDLLSIGMENEKLSNRTDRAIPKATFHGHKVLVAEDVETNQRIVQEMLQLLGFDVYIAEHGAVAAEMYTEQDYSLILMDCQMPIMDGYEAARRIRAIEASRGLHMTPIIALTAGFDDKDKQRCMEAGMNGYVKKPFTLSEIERSISEQLQELAADTASLSQSVNKDLTGADASQNDVLNLSAIENIRDIENQTGKPLLPTLFQGYCDQMTDKLCELSENIESGDLSGMYKTAHAIKSMSANIGAEKVRALSAELESDGRSERRLPTQDSISLLTAAYNEFLIEFESTLNA